MRKYTLPAIILGATLIFVIVKIFSCSRECGTPTPSEIIPTEIPEAQLEQIETIRELTDIEKRMDKIGVLKRLKPEVFEYALFGIEHLDPAKKDIITIVDFSKPSTEERLFVIDIVNNKLLLISHVAHGEKSGKKYATSFSNKHGSHQSTLGFYVTEKSYTGAKGYSMVIDGIEWGINEQVQWRGIVVHSADYADPVVIDSLGYLGTSKGCLVLPPSKNAQYIDTVKDGSLILVYANDNQYVLESKVVEAFKSRYEKIL